MFWVTTFKLIKSHFLALYANKHVHVHFPFATTKSVVVFDQPEAAMPLYLLVCQRWEEEEIRNNTDVVLVTRLWNISQWVFGMSKPWIKITNHPRFDGFDLVTVAGEWVCYFTTDTEDLSWVGGWCVQHASLQWSEPSDLKASSMRLGCIHTCS